MTTPSATAEIPVIRVPAYAPPTTAMPEIGAQAQPQQLASTKQPGTTTHQKVFGKGDDGQESRAEPGQSAGLGKGIMLALAASLSNQVGAATGALAFPSIGPVGVVSIRQLVTAAVLVPIGRPKFRSMTWAQWWPVLCLGVVFGIMNTSVYVTIDRLGLGLAITLEFLGPLAIAILSSRRVVDLFCGLLAAAGVYILVNPNPSTDVLGVAIGLVSGAAWACYVLLNRQIGRRMPGLQGAGAASLVSAIMWVPIAAIWFSSHPPALWALGFALICALLSSVVPFSIDLIALRRVPAGIFSTLQSMHPVWAAIVGLVMLHEVLAVQEWLGIALVVASNVLVTTTSMRRARVAA